MRFAYNILLLGLALQMFAYLGQQFGFFFYTFDNPATISAEAPVFGLFAINEITAAILGGGIIAIGVGAIITRSGTYALYSLLIFGIGIFVSQVQDFFLAIPKLLLNFDWPMFAGTEISMGVPLMGFVSGILVFSWGYFLLELITQRNHT